MGLLNYTATVSLDGYIADAMGDFAWAAPSEEVFAAHVHRMQAVTTEIIGRKTYQLMNAWDTEPADEPWSDDEQEFARLWSTIDKVVVSSTLHQEQLTSAQDRLVRRLPLDEVQQIVHEAPGVVTIFGPTTASEAIRAGIVERFEFFIVPTMIGGGLAALPRGTRLNVRLSEHRIFDNGTAYLRYDAT